MVQLSAFPFFGACSCCFVISFASSILKNFQSIVTIKLAQIEKFSYRFVKP